MSQDDPIPITNYGFAAGKPYPDQSVVPCTSPSYHPNFITFLQPTTGPSVYPVLFHLLFVLQFSVYLCLQELNPLVCNHLNLP